MNDALKAALEPGVVWNGEWANQIGHDDLPWRVAKVSPLEIRMAAVNGLLGRTLADTLGGDVYCLDLPGGITFGKPLPWWWDNRQQAEAFRVALIDPARDGCKAHGRNPCVECTHMVFDAPR